MISPKIDNVFIEILTDFNGIIVGVNSGNFIKKEFLIGESIYQVCNFLIGTLDALTTNEVFSIEGMVVVSNNQEYNVDLDLYKSDKQITVIIYNQTKIYKVVDKLNQGRNDLFFLKQELAKKNEELIKLRAIADKANEEKSRFLAMMSHEVRNPLNVILGYTDLINKENTSLTVKEYLKYLTISGKNLKVIVDDILDLSRVEAGKLVLSNEPINIVEVLNQVENNYKSNHKDLDVKLIFNNHKNLPKLIYGDDVRLIQILTNLINNAIKFTPNGSVTTSVNLISSDDKTALLSFKVKDTGRGMTEEQATKIFDEYQQNKLSDSRVHKGVGLGLSIVKRLVNQMYGKIKVDSLLKYGTTITVDVLFKIVPETEANNSLSKQNKENVSLKGKKILVADDNYLNLSIVSHILKKEGVIGTFVKDGEEAILAMNKDSFDIVLLDINMPNLKGDELIKRKEEMKSSNSGIPFLALTANNSKEDVESYKNLGFSEVIPKPFTAVQLKEILKSHL
ncbi:ATP-binding protein [uncultured Polaribacter sp.]|uniref:hybrid sensor histidine kinase/response regulator n=1 Tax=uncultured Polaribacter sp. TaxID=174711 RepID=UPI00260B3642|nr:ATP-binding protein [uncultured Polaribacter sp.]